MDTSINKNKSGKTKKTGRDSVIRIIGLTLLLVLLILAAAFVASDVFGRRNVNNSSSSSGELFYAMTADNIVSMEPFGGDGLVVLTDTAVKYFDAYGNSIGSNEYTYAKPVMRTAGKNLVLFDRGSYALRLEKNGMSFSDLSFDSPVTTAAIGKKGNYAYVLNSNGGFQSHLYVFNFRGAKQYEWGCSSDYIIDIALSDNEKYVCAAVMGADNAEYFSEVVLFRMNSDESVYSVKLAGITVYSVSFISGKKIAAYTDHGVYVFDGDGKYEVLQSYTPGEMKFSSAAQNSMGCTLINQFGNEKNVLFTVFSKNYKSFFTKEYSQSVKCVHAASGYAAAVFKENIEIFNSEGSIIGNISLDDVCLGCKIAGRNVYVLMSDGIRSYGVNSESTDTVR